MHLTSKATMGALLALGGGGTSAWAAEVEPLDCMSVVRLEGGDDDLIEAIRVHGVTADVPECLARLRFSDGVVAEARQHVSLVVVPPPLNVKDPPELHVGWRPGRKTQFVGGMVAAGGGTLVVLSAPIAFFEVIATWGEGPYPVSTAMAVVGAAVAVSGGILVVVGTAHRGSAKVSLSVSPQGVVLAGRWR